MVEVDVDIDDQIRIHVDGDFMIVHASDVVESVRRENMRGLEVAGTVLPDGTVIFREPLDIDFTDALD